MDEKLRELERRVQEAPEDVQAILALARALERADRPQEAELHLLDARDLGSREALLALDHYGTWDSARAGPSGTWDRGMPVGLGEHHWSIDIGGPQTGVAIAQGRLVAVTARHTLAAYDALTGNQLWEHPTPFGPDDSGPAVSDGVVFLTHRAADNQHVLALSAEDGRLRWTAGPFAVDVPPGMPGLRLIADSEGVLLTIGPDPERRFRLVCLRPKDGSQRWSTELPQPDDEPAWPNWAPEVVQGANLDRTWVPPKLLTMYEEEPEQVGLAHSALLQVLSLEDGSEVWRSPFVQPIRSLAMTGQWVVLTDTELVVLEHDGTTRWSKGVGGPEAHRLLFCDPATLVVVEDADVARTYSLANGAPGPSKELSPLLRPAEAVLHGRAYVWDDTGSLHCFDEEANAVPYWWTPPKPP